MKFPTGNQTRVIPEDTSLTYDTNNPLARVVNEAQSQQLAAERENYIANSIQYLFPYRDLVLYGPGQGPRDVVEPEQQNIKTDFQKQTIADFRLGDFHLMRGYVTAGDWTGVFLKIIYRGSPGTELGKRTAGNPGEFLQMFVKVGAAATSSLIRLPLNSATGNFEAELWSYAGAANLRDLLDVRGKTAVDKGFIQARPDLVMGSLSDFEGPDVDRLRNQLNERREGWQILDQTPNHSLHPVRPLYVEVAFANQDATLWDSNNGANFHLVFAMSLRGWRAFLNCGISGNPHGGLGFHEYRNLFSNYFFERRRNEIFGQDVLPELGRDLIPGNYDAMTYGTNAQEPGPNLATGKRECFMAVDYMDLHILQPECSIGIHRHRDNQDAFLMLDGHGLMLVGDWAEFPDRDRAFELRHLGPGDIAICKTGQLHAFYNVTDEPCSLFMFGGYD